MNPRIVTFLALGICLWLAGAAHSQNAQVLGRVVSPSGKGIEGASVKLVSSADDRVGRHPQARLSDVDGRFILTFDWLEVRDATQHGAVWEVVADKTDYAPGRATVQLIQGRELREVTIELRPKDDRDRLANRLDRCAGGASEATALIVFDFANDSSTPHKFSVFQELLGFKLRNGVRTKLESAGLLSDFPFEIRTCREAPVEDGDDAVFAAKRLGCPGVISGFIEEKANQLKSLVRFTAVSATAPPLMDFAPVVFSSDPASLIQPDQEVNSAYLAFSAYVLGEMYLRGGRTNLATKCFLYTKTMLDGSVMAAQADRLLKSLEPSNPARNLAPIGGPP